MRHWVWIIVFSITAGLCRGQDVPTDYVVDEILSVRSISAFECRLKDYPYASSARFRVQVRDVLLSAGGSADEAAAFTAERLRQAGRIELKNIRFRNYFRLIADVLIDGADLSAQLRAGGFCGPLDQTVPSDDPTGRRRFSFTEPVRLRPSLDPANSALTTGPVVLKRATLNSLLNTRVDLSALNDQTPLAEALEILADSVRPKLPLLILWNDLENNAMADKDTPIGVGGFGTLKLKQALTIILANVSRNGMQLQLAFEGRVITIGTQRGLLQKSVTRSYKIEDLVSPSYTEDGELNDTNLDTLIGTVQNSSSR